MIFSNNRRHRLLYIALAGMDVAWSLPWVDFFVGRWFGNAPNATGFAAALESPLVLFLFFWLALIGYMAAADWLNKRHILSLMRELWIVLLVLVTTFLAQVLLVYGPRTLQGSAWLGNLVSAILDFNRGLQPALVVFAYNLFLWWRVSIATGQGSSFYTIGLNFRLGMLIAIIGCALLALLDGATGDAIFYLLTFFAFGLTASALSRLDDKAWIADGRTGALLPWGRFAQLIASVLVTLLGATLVGLLLSPQAWGVYLRALSPVFSIFAPAGRALLAFLGWLLIPVGMGMEWLVNYLRGLISTQPGEPENIPDPMANAPDLLFSSLMNESPVLRYTLIAVGVLLALGLIWLFFVRTVAALRPDEQEETLPDEEIVEQSEKNRRGLRNLFGLARRFGLGRQLLAAISVQNLYANLTRLARRRGYPRPPATPPDRYLPTLNRAFPGQEPALARLTDAYMRVHYGEAPATSHELAQLRADYEAIRLSVSSLPTP